MKNEADLIELRSEKVRDLIGQIPPAIIRSGILIISLVLMILFAASYFFRYPELIKTAVIFQGKNDRVEGIIRLPLNKSTRIKKGQQVIIGFDKIKFMVNERFYSNVDFISKTIEINHDAAIRLVYLNIPCPIISDRGDTLILIGEIAGNAQIITDKISFLDRIIQPVKRLLNKTRSNNKNVQSLMN